MTYCVGMKLDHGLVFISDTRTNAGVDNISVFKKMFQWEVAGERSITLMTAGNLATTQAVVSLLNERSINGDDRGTPSIKQAPSMFQVAKLVGETLREVIRDQAGQTQSATAFGASMILGGQIDGGEPRMFLIYPEGNFVESCDDTPFFQIGETKYGKPILVRAYDRQMSFEEAVKLLLLSFDSTLKANLSVGMPLDLHMYEADSLRHGHIRRIDAEDPFFKTISSGWGEKLREAFDALPDYTLD